MRYCGHRLDTGKLTKNIKMATSQKIFMQNAVSANSDTVAHEAKKKRVAAVLLGFLHL